MNIIDFICCPVCRRDLRFDAESSGYKCIQCNKQYPYGDGIIDFFPEYVKAKKWAQKKMEEEQIVNIYESDKWRAGKKMAKQFGISLKDEIALIKRITEPGDGDIVLDLGCGPGIYARTFAKEISLSPEDVSTRGVAVGYDLSRPMLCYAVKKAEEEKIKNVFFMHGDAHILPFKNKTFHIVNCCGALHNFTDHRQVLNEIKRILKPGGRLSLAVGYKTSTSFGKFLGWISDTFFKVHLFFKEELVSLINEIDLEPKVYHATGTWMIAGGRCP